MPSSSGRSWRVDIDPSLLDDDPLPTPAHRHVIDHRKPGGPMSRPVFLVLSPDGEALAADLRRRYDADYRTETVPDAKALLTTLREITDPVALLIVDERVNDAIGLLDTARDLHPGAQRILLVERGQWTAAAPAVGVMALGRIDYHLYRPWRPLERILYASMAEF